MDIIAAHKRMTYGIGHSCSLYKRIGKDTPDTIRIKDINRSFIEKLYDIKMVMELACSNTKQQNWIEFSKASILEAGNFQIGNDAYVSSAEDGQDIHVFTAVDQQGRLILLLLPQTTFGFV